MCGIVGVCHLTGPCPVSREEIEKMLGAIRHRGPDESGIYLDDRTGLGHNRLSIIDLTTGTQPIHNEDRTLWIVYNGEIFNYPELKEELLKRGHRFYTDTDTEVILHLFEERGPACVTELNGQFALVIWDRVEKALFMARDRLGIRPLHYVLDQNRLMFASEIKSLFATGEVKRELDPIAIDQIFTFWTTLGDRTAFKNVHELPPGHYLKAARGKVTVQAYWEIPFYSPDEQYHWTIDNLCERLRELLRDSIRIRLRSHVPVGCYLSGGLDSSGIAAYVKNDFNSSLHTYGIQFEEKAFDEMEYQRLMVSFLETDHTSIQATNRDIGAALPEVLWHCEKPLLRTAPVPLFMLSKAVRQNDVKVVLTGEGADEVFGGYQIFRETKVREFWARRPESKLRPLLIRRLYPYVFRDPKLEHVLRSFFARGLTKVADPFYSHLIRWQNTSRAKVFFSADLKAAIGNCDSIEELAQSLPSTFSRWDNLTRSQYLEMSIFLSNYLLSSQGDRVAMAHSVEIRLPYLDYRIVDFMGRVPSRWKIQGLNEKYILKMALKERLPTPIIQRPKQPYRAPIKASLFNGNAPYLEEVLSDGLLKQAGLFDPPRIRRLLKKLASRQHASEVDNMALAGVVSSQLIYRQFVSGFPYDSSEPVAPAVVFDMRSPQNKRPQS